jgi:hypothetical protein
MEYKISPLVWAIRWHDTLAVVVTLEHFRRLFDSRGYILTSDEQKQSGLGIPPYQVAEQLGHRIAERLLPAPELTLTDEYIAIVNSDEDVSFALPIEQFAPSLTFELRVEGDEQKIPEFLFIKFAEGRRATFDHISGTLEDPQCLAIVRIAHDRLGSKWRGNSIWSRDCQLPAMNRNSIRGSVGSLPYWQAQIRH